MTETNQLQKVRVILLDVDDTLLDFGACSREAVQSACHQTGIPWTEDLFATFQEMNAGFWAQIEAGTLTLRELWEIRWQRIFDRLGIQGDGPAFETAFHQALDVTHMPVNGALQTVQALKSAGYGVYAASNGRQKQQETRLELAGLSRWLDGVFTSEAAGVNKPDIRFYQYVMDQLHQSHPDLVPEQVLMVGDSYTADITGAQNAGMQTLWFRRDDLPQADFSRLDELPSIVRCLHKQPDFMRCSI
ncbi:YjjG family noncanonical pyrimidine nucleotidase [uncultured Faecalibaculum sp.]|uniref:YjjG family noncanonical pyrimidine nucleotidase n=1 Tax=uncultured Faecalibaculum sp. TaxID=1729681 RepID=UPI00261E8322|nr:YjjG family noncanonical pyrimidine nucleotidase [uncultured Faecalibaculum sp.]